MYWLKIKRGNDIQYFIRSDFETVFSSLKYWIKHKEPNEIITFSFKPICKLPYQISRI